MSLTDTGNDPADHIAAGIEQLRDLIASGADLAHARTSIHVFAGDGFQLEMLGTALAGTGYTITAQGEGELQAETFAVVDEPWLREAMPILCRVADYFKVTYRGWTPAPDPKTVN